MVVKKIVSKKRVLKVKSTVKKKLAIKKPVKSPSKKLVKKLIASVKKPAKLIKLGKVIHYYNHIKVGIVKILAPVKEGQAVQFKGATTDFSQPARSMQINHVQVKKATKGKVIGLKVAKRVREGDVMYQAQLGR